MKQVNASQFSQWHIFGIMHKPPDCQIVMSALEQEGYQQMQQLYWYKEGHQSKTPACSYTNSVEMITIGFKPDRSKCGWNMGTDPRKRHNHFVCKSVTNYFKYEDGTIVNPCQKPPELMRWLCQNHLHAGSTVLILGAGSGADIIGATQACCNVVAVELDTKQYGRLQTTIVKYSTAVENQLGIDDEEDVVPGDKRLSTGSSNSAVEEESTETEGSTVCPECKSKLLHSEVDMKRVCALCNSGYPLHQNCAEQMSNGEWMCHTCCQFEAGVGDDQADEDVQ